jgi:hypothetical protein
MGGHHTRDNQAVRNSSRAVHTGVIDFVFMGGRSFLHVTRRWHRKIPISMSNWKLHGTLFVFCREILIQPSLSPALQQHFH